MTDADNTTARLEVATLRTALERVKPTWESPCGSAFNGETMCVARWADRIGISAGTLIARLRKGWSAERALTQPLDTTRIHAREAANV